MTGAAPHARARALGPAVRTGLGVLLVSWWCPAAAQTPPGSPSATQVRRPAATRPGQGVRVRAFGDIGLRRFTSSQAFEAVLGSATGPLYGGGVEVLWGRHLSVEGAVSRYRATGERVFVSGGDVFPLGIPARVTVMPVSATVSYRFPMAGGPAARVRGGAEPGGSLIPFVGAGVNVHRYTETSDFAEPGDDLSSTFTGLHVQGGAEWRLSRLVGLAGVGRWSSVRDAIGTEPTSAAAAFGEHDLGGFDAAIRVIIGRR